MLAAQDAPVTFRLRPVFAARHHLVDASRVVHYFFDLGRVSIHLSAGLNLRRRRFGRVVQV